MKFRPTRSALFSAALMLCLPALFGADGRGMTQMEMTADAGVAWQTADVALNAIYKKFLATKAGDAEAKRKLVEAEQWIKYRDAECDSAADDYRGGSIAPMVRYECAKNLTEARTADLQSRLDDR